MLDQPRKINMKECIAGYCKRKLNPKEIIYMFNVNVIVKLLYASNLHIQNSTKKTKIEVTNKQTHF